MRIISTKNEFNFNNFPPHFRLYASYKKALSLLLFFNRVELHLLHSTQPVFYRLMFKSDISTLNIVLDINEKENKQQLSERKKNYHLDGMKSCDLPSKLCSKFIQVIIQFFTVKSKLSHVSIAVKR